MTTLQDRLRDAHATTHTRVLMDGAADTLDKAAQIIERLAMRLPVGDHATIEARRFLDGHNAKLSGAEGVRS